MSLLFVNFEHISHIVLVVLLSPLIKWLPAGLINIDWKHQNFHLSCTLAQSWIFPLLNPIPKIFLQMICLACFRFSTTETLWKVSKYRVFFWSILRENTDQKKLRIWTLFTQCRDFARKFYSLDDSIEKHSGIHSKLYKK